MPLAGAFVPQLLLLDAALPSPPAGSRFLRIAKSPAAPNAAFAYQVTGAGLEVLPDVEPPAQLLQPGSVVHGAIANDVPFEQDAAAAVAFNLL